MQGFILAASIAEEKCTSVLGANFTFDKISGT